MKIYIMTDMEGVSGIRREAEVSKRDPAYARGQALFVGDVNAAVAGAFDGGATEVLVWDSHSGGGNLPLAQMDPRADYCDNGGIREFIWGLDRTYAGYFAIGYHARAGTGNAFLEHTQCGESVFNYTVNGVPYGELGQQALLAGAHGVPQLLVSGDQAACAEALELTPGIETVAVKAAYGHERTRCLHPEKAQGLIRQAAARAVRLAGKLKPLQLAGPYDVRLTFTRPRFAEQVWRQRPWLERVDGCTVRFVTNDISRILAVF